MAYEPTDWKNREVERPRTFTLQENDDGTITLIPAEGKVTEPGTPIVAPLLNKIEGQLVELDDRTLNMYSLTDGPKTKNFSSGHINDLKETGLYSTNSASVSRGFPADILLTVLIKVYLGSDGALVQETLYINGGSSIKYFRTQSVSAGAWSAWNRIPFLGDDLKANKAQENLITTSPLSGWSAMSAISYYKDQFNIVHVKGWITSGSNTSIRASGTKLFSLPVGYRPVSGIVNFSLGTNTTATDGRTVNAFLFNGTLELDGTSLGNILIDLSFRI